MVLLENEPQFEQWQQPISCLTQSEITNSLKQREDILINSDKKVLEGISRKNYSEITEEQQLESEANQSIKEETQDEVIEPKEIDMKRTKTEQKTESSFEQSLLSSGFK